MIVGSQRERDAELGWQVRYVGRNPEQDVADLECSQQKTADAELEEKSG